MDAPPRRRLNVKATAVAAVFLAAVMGTVFLLLETGARPRARNNNAARRQPAAISAQAITAAEAAVPDPPAAYASSRSTPSPRARQLFVEGQRAYLNQDMPEAIRAFEEAIREAPNFPDLHLALAACYEQQRQWEPAYKAIKRYVELTTARPTPGLRN